MKAAFSALLPPELIASAGDGLDELLEKKGPVVNIRILWDDLIFTASPEHIKLILATDFNNYVKGQYNTPDTRIQDH